MDCGPTCCVNAVLALSGGKVGPRTIVHVPGHGDPADDAHRQRQEDADWVQLFRDLAKNPDKPFLIRGDIAESLNSPHIDRLFRAQGLPGIRAEYHAKMSWQDMKAEARQDHVIILAHDYGVLRQGKAPTASQSFSGDHVLNITGLKSVKRRVYINDGDPLFDGRLIPGPTPGRYPDGYQVARLPQFRKAAARFNSGDGGVSPGMGYATCVVVKGGLH